jgi:hypothetical protein
MTAAVAAALTAVVVVAVVLVVIGNHLCLSRIVKTQAFKRNDKDYETCKNST